MTSIKCIIYLFSSHPWSCLSFLFFCLESFFDHHFTTKKEKKKERNLPKERKKERKRGKEKKIER